MLHQIAFAAIYGRSNSDKLNVTYGKQLDPMFLIVTNALSTSSKKTSRQNYARHRKRCLSNLGVE
jgi:hypothetical protein